MSGYDYASEMLSARSAPPQQPVTATDYASDLFGPKRTFSQAVEKAKGDVEGTASFGALTKAASVDDPRTKMRIYAQDLFPGDREAVERFGVHNGAIVYVGKDDKLYKAEPSGPLGGAKSIAANTAGNALPIIGGTAGAIAGAPGGIPGAVGLGALGAAGGKSLQQIIANLALDEPQTPGGNLLNQGKEATFAAGGGLVGGVLQKWLTRNAARDVARFDPVASQEAKDRAAKFGVDLNIAQQSNLPTLKGRVEAIAHMSNSAADDMNARLEATRQQAGAAADAFVEGVAPNLSVRDAGEAGRRGAQTILKKMGEERSAAARPLYDKAMSTQIDARDETLSRLADTPAFKSAWERAKRIAANEGTDLGDSVNTMQGLHYIKLGLDDLIERGAQEGIGGTERRAIIQVKDRLLNFMDNASPDYKKARSVYAHFMPTIKAEKEGLVGRLSELADLDLQQASKSIFSTKNSPQDIANLRAVFERYGQKEEWQALTKGYLQDTLENASKEFKSGNVQGRAVTWRYMMLGDQKQAANLKAAMTPEQWTGFNEMMDVFETVGRTTGRGNSITMQMQEASKQLSDEAKSKWANLLKPRQAIIDWLEEAKLGRHVEKQVEILSDPNGLKRLKELRRLHPEDKKLIQGFSTLFGIEASPE